MGDAEDRLERESELADARLGTAEALAWLLAMFAGAWAHLRWDWVVGILVAIAAYVIATHPYRKAAALAEDRYNRAAGLGKYAALNPGPAAE